MPATPTSGTPAVRWDSRNAKPLASSHADEADAFIEQLEAAAQSESPSPVRTPMPRPTTAERALREVSSELLAAELQRRGWIVAEP